MWIDGLMFCIVANPIRNHSENYIRLNFTAHRRNLKTHLLILLIDPTERLFPFIVFMLKSFVYNFTQHSMACEHSDGHESP